MFAVFLGIGWGATVIWNLSSRRLDYKAMASSRSTALAEAGDLATIIERNRCADAVKDPMFLHCQGFRNSDRVRLAEKIRSGE